MCIFLLFFTLSSHPKNEHPKNEFLVREGSIINIRRSDLDLTDEILDGLKRHGMKHIPSVTMYDTEGLRLFEKLTYSDDYYLTRAEMSIFENHADDIAAHIPTGAAVVELGSGLVPLTTFLDRNANSQENSNLRKTQIILEAIDRAGNPASYYALDVYENELIRTLQLSRSQSQFKHVKMYGLSGTYEDGVAWLASNMECINAPKVLLWLGSSFANYPANEAGQILSRFSRDISGNSPLSSD